jgi:ABC-type sugar transport system substrate-binding protein
MQLKPQIVGMVEILHAAEVQRRITQALKDAAAKVGWKVITCDTAGDPAKASSCAQSLMTQGATAMTSMGVDPSTMGAQMKQAQSKGIPWLGLVGTERQSPLFTAQINQPDQQAISDVMSQYIMGRLQAADASGRKSGGFAYSTFPAIYGIGLRDTKTAAALRAAGIKQINRHVTDLANNAADARQWARSVLARTPDVGAFFTTLDIDQGEIANAVAAKFPGKAFPDRPLVVGLAAGLGTLDKIRKGLIDADVEVAVEAASWMGIDQLAEFFARKTPLATDLWAGNKTAAYPEWFLKPYTVTKENAPKQPGVYHDPPYDFVTYFTSKWGKEFGAA